MKLKATPPHDAKNRYLKDKSSHVSDKTIYNYDTALTRFLEFLDMRNIDDMRDVDSDLIQQFEQHRLESVKPVTCRNDIRTVKNFIEFCETIQACPVGLHELIRPTKVPKGDEVCDTILTKEEADAILDYLNTYHYASTRHAILLVLWKTGMRVGALRSLDVSDFNEGKPALELRNRPGKGTPLKKRERGERNVFITLATAEILSDYIETNRTDSKDEYGRQPLFSSKNGRMNIPALQKNVYAATRPCTYNGDNCPYGKDTDTCEAMRYDRASKCPGSVSPHALRRGYVTAARNAGQPKDVTGERVDMGKSTLDKHYDHGNHDEKLDRRKDHLRDI
jgi:integrase